jgi:hypothetical protein
MGESNSTKAWAIRRITRYSVARTELSNESESSGRTNLQCCDWIIAHIENFSKMFGNTKKSRYNRAAYAAHLSGEEVKFPPAKAAVRPHHSPDALDRPMR